MLADSAKRKKMLIGIFSYTINAVICDQAATV